MGLSNFDGQGWVWTDNSPLNFASWDYGEPNDANGGEKCGQMLFNG